MSVEPYYGEGPVPSGWVRLRCTDPYLNLASLLGPDSPLVTGGLGGWEVTRIPRSVGMTTWEGSDPYALQFGLVMVGAGKAGWISGGTFLANDPQNRDDQWSLEPAIRALRSVARGDNESPPGIVEIHGIPNLPADRWVIEEIDETDDVIRRVSDMHRIRQVINLTFREYRPPTYKRLARRALQGKMGKTTTIKIKKGDTPAIIAKRRKCKWTDLRKLNPTIVKKAHQNLPDGRKLRVPVIKQDKRRDRKKD